MSGELPSPWAQSYPRAVRLAPNGLLVPAATLRVHLARGRAVELLYTGFALEPWIDDGTRFMVRPGGEPRPGDLVLCDAGGWADVRRVLRRECDGELLTALDPVPGARERLPSGRLLGTVLGVTGAGGALGRVVARGFPIWSRMAAFLYWRRKILAAPSFGSHAAESVREKYQQQAGGYRELAASPPDPVGLDLLRARVRPGAAVLVAGSGAGSEALSLAREGYRVTGLDFAPAMVEASLAGARAAGIEAEFLLAEMGSLDLGPRRFDAAYVTPVVYSLIPGRERRIDALRGLGRHLAGGGPVIFTTYVIRDLATWIESLLAWIRGRRVGAAGEFGDWYTRYMTPRGTIGTSFIHRSLAGGVLAEARAAGFTRVERRGAAHFIAGGFRDPRRPPARS